LLLVGIVPAFTACIFERPEGARHLLRYYAYHA
jgi:hypothetical protein